MEVVVTSGAIKRAKLQSKCRHCNKSFAHNQSQSFFCRQLSGNPMDLYTIDVISRWREDWQSATVVNSTLVIDPTIQLPGFDLHRRQWSLLYRFWTGQGHLDACHKKWGFTDNELCDCGEIQTMSHIVNSCPLTTFDGGLLHLHEADEAAVDWLTTYGS